jgi:hypothetical protein
MKRTFLRFAAFMLLAMGGTAASFAEEVTDVTFGFDETMTDNGDGTGTIADFATTCNSDILSLEWITDGFRSVSTEASVTWTWNNVTYTGTKAIQVTFNASPTQDYYGYKVVIPEGSTFTLKSVKGDVLMTFQQLSQQIKVETAEGSLVWKSDSNYVRKGAWRNTINTTLTDNVELSAGTYLFKGVLSLTEGGGGKQHTPVALMFNGELKTVEQPKTPGFSITDAGYATVVTPADKAVTFPNDVKVWKATKIDGSTVTMTELSGIIPAATPVLVSGSKGDYELTTTDDDATADVTGNMLIGYNTDTEITATDMESYTYYSLNAAEDGTAGFYRRTEAFTAKAGKAYLRVNGATQTNTAKMGMFFDDNTTTGISGIETGKSNDGVYYNLNGQRISAPAKGLYILNGKKYVSK